MSEEDKKKPKTIGDYRIGKVLGTGSYGYVRLGVNIITGEQFAIKTLKDAHNKKGIQREIAILRLLDHPNIVKLHDVVEDVKTGTFYLVLELAGGGELFDYIVARGRLREKEARKFFRQIISGVEYCHSSLVIHRDLKPENLLLDVDGNIKINDFGFSNIMVPGERFSTFCGSVSYVAPEIIKNIKYVGPEIDIWSMGVILYTLVCGRLPWPETTDGSPAITNIIDGDYDVVPLTGLSEACRDLIKIILVPSPSERATLAQIRMHPWVNEGFTGPPPCLVSEFPPVVQINEEILTQLLKIGFDQTPEVVRARLLSNERCPEVAVYNLLMQKYYPQERPSAASMPLTPSSSDDNLELPEGSPVRSSSALGNKFGSGAGRKFANRASRRISGMPPAQSSYGEGHASPLAGIVSALSNPSDFQFSSGSSPPSASPNPMHSPPSYARRSTVADHAEASAPERDRSQHRLSLGVRSSTPNPASPNKAPPMIGAREKRKSVILTNLETSFKNLFHTNSKIKEVKGVFSVDTTTTAPPALVVEEIIRILDLEKDAAEQFRLKYKQKGYVFKCRYPHQHLEFTLEVCKIKKMDLTGVKSKRLKGDLWVYKDYCQRIIAKLKL
jgi:MAP/microtubule affinity-regulating kinase